MHRNVDDACSVDQKSSGMAIIIDQHARAQARNAAWSLSENSEMERYLSWMDKEGGHVHVIRVETGSRRDA